MNRFAYCFTFLALFAASAGAMVVTGVSVNGVRLVSNQEYATALPINIMIASTVGSPVLFNFTLAPDATQNPNESTVGDSLSVSFMADPLSGLLAPADFSSITYFDGALPQIPASLSFSRNLAGPGAFNGSFTLHMSNSTADYFSFFTGYEVNPTFRFSLINSPPLSPITPPPPVHPPPAALSVNPPPAAAAGPDVGVPEPGSMGLVFAGGLMLFAKSRKKLA